MATAKKKIIKATPVKAQAKKSVSGAKKKAEPKKTATKVATSKTAAKKTETKAKAVPKTQTPPKAKVSTKTTTKATKSIEPAKKSSVFRCSISGIPVKSEKPNLNPKTLQKLKDLLLEERAKHLAQADELELEAAELIADREAGDTQFDEESGEGDSVAVERERTLFLSAEAHNTVKQIDRALARIEDGTYGVCVPSSRRLPVARLEALPWTEVCVDCKSRSERRR